MKGNHFSVQNNLANELLQRHGTFVVRKATRSGCTLSLIKASCESGKRVVVFSPTVRILRQVEEEIPKITSPAPRIAPILSNPELCTKVQPNPKLKFQFKHNCKNCEYRGKPQQCVFQDLIMNEFDVYCLTYSKLQALQKSTSEDAKLLLEKLRKCEVFIFDEFTTVIGAVPTIEMVKIDYESNVIRMGKNIRATFKEEFERSDKIMSEDIAEIGSALFKESDFWGIHIDLFLAKFEDIKQSGIYKNFVVDFLPEDEMKSIFHYGWSKITKLTNEGRNTAELQEVFLMAFAEEVIVTCEDGVVKLTPRLEDALGYISEFCKKLGEEKSLFIVDSYQPSVSFDSVFTRPVKHELWGETGDPLGTNEKQLVVCDTAHWGALDFLRDKKLQRKVRLFVNGILAEFLPEQVLIVTTNKKMAGIISQWHLPKDVRVTWFRSDWMRGVSVEDRRIMICVGGPYIPKKAYDASARSFRIESFAEDLELLDDDAKTVAISRLLRLDDTRSEFINSIGRVKDPRGKERSVVFTLGMQGHEVGLLLRQDAPISQPNLTRPFRYGGMHRDGLWIAKLWLNDSIHINLRDLPLVARIISRTRSKLRIRASEIVPGMTAVVVETAKRYRYELQHYKVAIVEKRGGVSFCVNYFTPDHFLREVSD